MLREPLLNKRLVDKRLAVAPIPAAHAEVLHRWADSIREGSITAHKETGIRRPFLQMLFVDVLGYTGFGSGAEWTIQDEHVAGSGSMDVALGRFTSTRNEVIAPFELKGPRTGDLDAIMPGRHKSPVQQAWEYAMDTPGCRYVLVSNMLELRLYAVGHGRQAYEVWHLVDLIDPREYARLQLVLSAQNMLSGATDKLLGDSTAAEKDITRELYRDYQKLRVQLIVALAQANPDHALVDLIGHAQTLLDRVLFVAFAEDRELLPEHTLRDAAQARNEYNPQPAWDNFRGLFRAIDQGNAALGIPAYNGGLFAHHPVLDTLRVPDDVCRAFGELGHYDFASEVGVTVLGHIFEQSVADIEELREAAGAGTFELKAKEQVERAAASGVRGRRKQEGVVYTPDSVTAFIVEQTLGGYLHGRFETLLRDFVADPENPRDADDAILWKRMTKDDPLRKQLPRTTKGKSSGAAKGDVEERAHEYFFWRAWLDELRDITVLDPACGSGAFLVAAFDFLAAEYARVNEQLQAITGSFDLFDLNKAILNGNLFGVDVNAESVEITKLSLWLKTAQRGKPLTSLEANIHLGNSLIRGQEYSPRAFDWQTAFGQVFARGGFDVVIGNPPYVRMERIKPIKPYLEQHYEVASDRADLYCYFYELGVRLLKAGGRLGYISSSTFFKTGSGAPLRKFLLRGTHLLAMVDFGDLQVFEGVTTYPAIVVVEKRDDANVLLPSPAGRGAGGEGSESPDTTDPQDANPHPALRATLSRGEREKTVRFLVLTHQPDSLSAAFEQHAQTMPQAQLGDGAGSWQLESRVLAALRRKLLGAHPTLKQVYGSPLYGIKTGLNEAFVIDRATRDELIARDPRSQELLKPFLVGEDLKKWRIEPQDRWLIYIPKNTIAIEDYPAIRDHLASFRHRPDQKKDLERRATLQSWFELQQGAVGQLGIFESPKIVYPEISQGQKFSIERRGLYANKTVFSLPSSDEYLLGLLNSKLAWFYFLGCASALRGGEWRLLLQQIYIETLPVPATSAAQREQIAELARNCQHAAEQRRDLRQRVIRRIPDLAPGGRAIKLSGKLQAWWQLDFAAFRAEVKKTFKQDIPLAERGEWEGYLNAERVAVLALDARIAQTEAQLDRAVYALFGLDESDIALLESA